MEENSLEIRHQNRGHWQIFEVKGAIDAVSTKKLSDCVNINLPQGPMNIVFNLERTSFCSLPSIKYLNDLAQNGAKVGCQIFIVGANDRTKRHIEVFASLKFMRFCNQMSELPISYSELLNLVPYTTNGTNGTEVSPLAEAQLAEESLGNVANNSHN